MQQHQNQQPPATISTGALAALSLSVLLSALGVSIANIALPTIAHAFGSAFSAVQWVVIAYALAVTLASVGAGRLSDQLGQRTVMLAALLLFAAASALCAIAPTLPLLVGARFVQGLSAAALLTVALALVRDTAAPEKTGQIMGLLGTMSAVGTALGPTLGGILLANGNWRLLFLVLAPVAVTAFALGNRYLPKPSGVVRKAQSFDLPGLGFLSLALTGYALAMTMPQSPGVMKLALMAGAGAALALFAVVEQRVTAPLVDLRMLRDAKLAANLASNVAVAMVMMATLLVAPFYLGTTLGLSQVEIGMAMAVGPLVSMLSGVPAGRSVDRWGATVMSSAGLAAITLGCLALAFLPAIGGLAGYLVAIAIVAPGYQLFQAANNTAVMMDVAQDKRGLISGLLNLSRNIGLVSGASVMGAIFTAASGAESMSSASSGSIAQGLTAVFLFGAGVMAVMVLLQRMANGSSRRLPPGPESSAAAAPSSQAQE